MAFFSAHVGGACGVCCACASRNMGSGLSRWETVDPLARVTEKRLRVIRSLDVSSASIGSLLALKASSMVALESITFSDDLPFIVQDDIARSIAAARAVRAIVFDGLAPADRLVEAILRMPLLQTLQFSNMIMTASAARVLAAGVAQSRLTSLQLKSVVMPPAATLQITSSCPKTCRVSLFHMAQ